MSETDQATEARRRIQHTLPTLPYEMDALEPYISRETIEYHYGKHHAGYVKKLNELIAGTEFESLSLEQIILKAKHGPIFNNAAQVWNHTFYWNCMSAAGGGALLGDLPRAIDKAFGNFDAFKRAFMQQAADLFGSGWVWLVRKPDGSLAIEATSDAGTPMTSGSRALLTCDVWEHAYYIDYRNERADYLQAFWDVVNWEFAAANL
jgi:superoxide dismutase, Fe-Mn family